MRPEDSAHGTEETTACVTQRSWKWNEKETKEKQHMAQTLLECRGDFLPLLSRTYSSDYVEQSEVVRTVAFNESSHKDL